mmetsp:Transcript_2819/g.8419  ORF Transcript_2819/g.8419 Transcript_2819/m.8419 type:complete len:209 (-) Transcript_2819:397-1023(-)
MFPVVHEVGGHRDLVPHHIGETGDRTVRVGLKYEVHRARVRGFVPRFIRRNQPRNSRQHGIPRGRRQARRRAVGHLGRPLLERRVDQAPVRVMIRLNVHPAPDQSLNSTFYCPHVYPARQVQVLVEQVAVAILLRRPLPRPSRVRGRRRTRLVTNPIQGVKLRHVRRQRLLGDHIADQDHQNVIWKLSGTQPQVAHLVVEPIRVRRVR